MIMQTSEDRVVAAALADTVEGLVQCVSRTGELLFVNRAWRDRLGYSNDDLRLIRNVDLVAPSQRARYILAYEKLFDGIDIGTISTQFVTLHGALIDIDGSLTRVLVSGNTVAALGIFTQRKAVVNTNAPYALPVGRRVALTNRQQAVLQLFATGHTTKQVAAELNIAVKTVHNHLTTIYRVLDAQSLVQATMIAAQLGIVELAAPMR